MNFLTYFLKILYAYFWSASLFKADAAEEFRTVEHRLFKVNRAPAQEVRFGEEVAAFVEIGGHFHSIEGVYPMDEQGRGRNDFGKLPPDVAASVLEWIYTE